MYTSMLIISSSVEHIWSFTERKQPLCLSFQLSPLWTSKWIWMLHVTCLVLLLSTVSSIKTKAGGSSWCFPEQLCSLSYSLLLGVKEQFDSHHYLLWTCLQDKRTPRSDTFRSWAETRHLTGLEQCFVSNTLNRFSWSKNLCACNQVKTIQFQSIRLAFCRCRVSVLWPYQSTSRTDCFINCSLIQLQWVIWQWDCHFQRKYASVQWCTVNKYHKILVLMFPSTVIFTCLYSCSLTMNENDSLVLHPLAQMKWGSGIW